MTWADRVLSLEPIILPIIVIIAALAIGAWAQKLILRLWSDWLVRSPWAAGELITREIRRPWFIAWSVLAFLPIAARLSPIPNNFISFIDRILWSLAVLSVSWVAAGLAGRLIRFYSPRFALLIPGLSLFERGVPIAIFSIGFFIWLTGLGLPVTPVVVGLGIAMVIAITVLQDPLYNLAALIQLILARHVEEGAFVKLDSGEDGYVKEMGWRETVIEGLDGRHFSVPNRRLLQATVVKYQRPLPQAKEPFHFYTRLALREFTGLKAANLRELVRLLKIVPEGVIYYHTHQFVQEHHYLNPQLPNDLARWVSEVLREEALGEKLASIDPCEFDSLEAIRHKLVITIEEHLERYPDSSSAPAGREFHFVKAISIVLPTPYVAHDLQEFAEILRYVSTDSIYYHVFESRLRLGRGKNDFSRWLELTLGEKELADKISRLNPYSYTLEGLRTAILEYIERRLKELTTA